jgi:ectoine hydroxylase-related dioxygenase (phytanoyl-CoA dioxygenase family)
MNRCFLRGSSRDVPPLTGGNLSLLTDRARFAEDGVVCVRGALEEAGLALAESAFRWSLANPGPCARDVLAGEPGAFYQDHANPLAFAAYQPLLCRTGLARLVADIMGSEALWLLYEQVWLKQGDARLRTPWHQDLAYVPMEGAHMATLWLNLDPVPQEISLEFVRASHRGPLHNPTAFDAKDPAAAMFEPGVWPALPDIDSRRDAFDIISWNIAPGDIVMFHPGMLHGGAPTPAGGRRRTISLRFFGDHTYCAGRPETGVAEVDRLQRAESTDPIEQLAFARPGTLFRHPAFQRLV